jgi:predicted permease
MRALLRMMAAVRNLLHRRRVESDLDAELRAYVDLVTEERIAAGMTPEAARRSALAELGGTEPVKQAVRDSRAGSGIETIWQDVRFAIRILRKSPGFTAVVVLTLALGIGANTAIFTLVNAVLLKTIPVSHPEELVVPRWSAHNRPNGGMSSFGDCTMNGTPGSAGGCSLSHPMYRALAERHDLFTSVAAFAGTLDLNLAGNGQASIAQGELVSGSYFDTLGIRPALGRTIDATDDQKGASAVAVLDYGYWKQTFGGSPGVLGRTVRLNNVPFTIVGVADQGFTRLTPGKVADLYVAISQAKALGMDWADPDDPTAWWVTVIARLKSGVKRTEAEAAVSVAFQNFTLHAAKPSFKTAADDPKLRLIPAQDGLSGFRRQLGEPLRLLMAATGIVLLIACANVAGLLLARSTSRERELAVRLALGASRRRVMQQMLTESVLLSLAGAALGTLLAYALARALAVFAAANWYGPLHVEVSPDLRLLLFTVSVALATGIGFGLAPAIRGARTRSAAEMSRGTTESAPVSNSAGRRRPNLGSTLVVLQVALSIVMLTSAGLLLRTLGKLRSIDVGFDTSNVLLLGINPEIAGYNKKQVVTLYGTLQQRLSSLPGVMSASYSSSALLDGSSWTESVKIPGQTSNEQVSLQMLGVGPHYFETMRLPLLRGRSLGVADIKGGPPVAIVNEAFVQKFLKGRDPLGVQFGPDDKDVKPWTIVGVVRDAKYASLEDTIEPTAYVPLDQGGATFSIRTAIAPEELMQVVRKTVQDVDINVPIMQMRTQSESIDRLLFNQRLMARLLAGFAVLGLGLACIGLYGLLSYEVARRTREIGVRTALGAQRRDVLLLFLSRGLIVVLLGAAAGIGAAAAVTRLLGTLLYGVRALDPWTFAGAAAVFLLVGLTACFLPTSRAMRVDPAVALRCE